MDTGSGEQREGRDPNPPEGELLSRVELIEAQPLAERAVMLEQIHDELVAELQREDREHPGA